MASEGFFAGAPEGEGEFLDGTGNCPVGPVFGEAGGAVDGVTFGVAGGGPAPLVGAGGGPAGTAFEGEADGAVDGVTFGVAGGGPAPLVGADGGPAGTVFEGVADGADGVTAGVEGRGTVPEAGAEEGAGAWPVAPVGLPSLVKSMGLVPWRIVAVGVFLFLAESSYTACAGDRPRCPGWPALRRRPVATRYRERAASYRRAASPTVHREWADGRLR